MNWVMQLFHHLQRMIKVLLRLIYQELERQGRHLLKLMLQFQFAAPQ